MTQKSDAKALAPFFILGCVRSGTTMLRNILRRHPNLCCPEESHFFRPAEPFGGPGYLHFVSNNQTLKKHRQIDGITEAEFAEMLAQASSRADLCERYMRRFAEVKKPQATRWFDKTPQNAYGASMIAAEMRKAKFVHMVRDPVNVVASLRIGKVVKMESLVASCSYWNEAIENLAVLKRAFPARVLDISYERFTADPQAGIRQILEFVGEPFNAAHFADVITAEVRHDQAGVLSPDELERVRQLCLRGRIRHGYAPKPKLEAAEG